MSGKPILGILLGDAAGVGPEIIVKLAAVSYTHLDVYKRQRCSRSAAPGVPEGWHQCTGGCGTLSCPASGSCAEG